MGIPCKPGGGEYFGKHQLMRIERIILLFMITIFFGISIPVAGQSDSTVLNQDAIYNRPFIGIGQSKTAVGGYLEMNTNYFSENGVSDGFSMELRRFNIFLYSQISNRIRFLSEIEFEPADEEIKLETALVDFELNSALNFRAGVLLPAIGLINTNHDSPRWEFVERPISSSQIIPTTLSEVGFGLFGKFYPGLNTVISYNAYLVNGLQDGIIFNEFGKTYIPSGRVPEMFGEDNNGTPMYNGRISFAERRIGEIGISWYGGVYNQYRLDGSKIDQKRSLAMAAFDFQAVLKGLTLQGEWVFANIDVPEDVVEIYGSKQQGGFIDVIYPIMKSKLIGFESSVINASLRLEYADLNTGEFVTNSNERIGDENKGIVFGLGWRPVSGTIIRFNYRYHWITDNLGNPPTRLAGFQFGFASYY